MYEEKWKVRFSECDREQKLSYGNIVNYFQDCSNLQSEAIGRGAGFLNTEQKAWLVDFWQIVINERPSALQNIKVATWASGFKGFFGIRNFTMKSENDHMLVYANSYWVYIDTVTGHPVRVPQDEAAAYGMEEPLSMDYAGRKISVPEEMEYVDTFVVKEHHLDLYSHMNNGRYIEAACDYLPKDCSVYQICCQYKMQAHRDDTIRVYRTSEDKKITIILKNMNEEIYSIISFDCK